MKATTVFRFARKLLRPATWGNTLRAVQALFEDQIFPLAQLRRGERTLVHPTANLRCAHNIVLGDDVRIQPGVCLWASPGSRIVIGNGSGLGPGCMFFSSNHRYRLGERYIDQPWEERDIVVGANVWIGSGCIVTAGVRIGEGSVIAAGSVVTRDIPPFSVAAGVPARIMRQGGAAPGATVAAGQGRGA